MSEDTPGTITIVCPQLLVGGRWEMYPALVYYGAFSLLAMVGDGDPDVTVVGTCKVFCEVTSICGAAIAADGQVISVITPWAATV